MKRPALLASLALMSGTPDLAEAQTPPPASIAQMECPTENFEYEVRNASYFVYAAEQEDGRCEGRVSVGEGFDPEAYEQKYSSRSVEYSGIPPQVFGNREWLSDGTPAKNPPNGKELKPVLEARMLELTRWVHDNISGDWAYTVESPSGMNQTEHPRWQWQHSIEEIEGDVVMDSILFRTTLGTTPIGMITNPNEKLDQWSYIRMNDIADNYKGIPCHLRIEGFAGITIEPKEPWPMELNHEAATIYGQSDRPGSQVEIKIGDDYIRFSRIESYETNPIVTQSPDAIMQDAYRRLSCDGTVGLTPGHPPTP